MATSKTTKRGGGGKWLVMGGLLLAVVVAIEAGWAGYGWAQLRSMIFPRDESLLAWIPDDTSAVVIIDPHQLELSALGNEGSTVRAALLRTRDDVKKATGIDLAFDVDKLALSSSLAVGRGRFDQNKLADKLTAHRYTRAEHEGRTYLVRAGEDAIAVIDDSILLYGDEAGVKAGLTAHAKGTSLEKNEQATARLRQAGWDHALVAMVRITDDKPSVREMLHGSAGPRAVMVTLSTKTGLDLDAHVEAASSGAADELAKLLEEKRKAEGGLSTWLGGDAANILADVTKKATVAAAPGTSFVKIHAHMEAAQLDALAKQAKAETPLTQMYKTVRLYQLLVPSL